MIGLAEVLLTKVDQADTLQLPRQRVDPSKPDCDGCVLAHVRVDEKRSARREHAGRFREHPPQRFRREVLEHVQGEGLRERAVTERQLSRRASVEKNGLMSTPTSEAPQSRFHNSVRPLPQPRSTTRSCGSGARNARSMSLRIFEPSSGGDTRSWRASTCSDSSRYFVCSANAVGGRRSTNSRVRCL